MSGSSRPSRVNTRRAGDKVKPSKRYWRRAGVAEVMKKVILVEGPVRTMVARRAVMAVAVLGLIAGEARAQRATDDEVERLQEEVKALQSSMQTMSKELGRELAY